MIRLAKQYGRYGYRKICELLEIEGRLINHKKVERIWREEGLQLPARHKRRKRLYHHNASIIRFRPHFPNHVWSIDFVHDKLSNGRPYKMLTVLDEYTREALAVTVAHKMGSSDVLEALYPLLLKRGKPEYLRSDNGAEFTGQLVDLWAYHHGTRIDFSRPGKPTDNAFIETFNGTLRDECLNIHWFGSINEAKRLIEAWRIDYNESRPHMALGNKTPSEYCLHVIPSAQPEGLRPAEN